MLQQWERQKFSSASTYFFPNGFGIRSKDYFYIQWPTCKKRKESCSIPIFFSNNNSLIVILLF